MTSARRQLIESLRQSANRLNGEERETFLAEACGADAELRREVEGHAADATFAGETLALHADQFGPYKLKGLLGAGAMGKVFRATDTRLNREVAIKVVTEYFGSRFEREARAISTFNHPHICTLYDIGPDYLVMELLDGSTLAQTIRKGPLPVDQVCRYGAQIASALVEAHARGIVHRDLKPGNIMVTRHGIKVLDFGLAKMTSETALTEDNAVMGTPGYMAPEQVEGSDVDARTDLFALGLVLYEMAAGELPLPGRSLGRQLLDRSVNAASHLSIARPEVPGTVDSLVASLLERDAARRCQSAADAMAVLSAIVDRPAKPARRTVRTAVLIPILLAVLLAVALAAVGGVGAYRRYLERRWAREEAVPEIHRLLGETKPVAAFRVLLRAEHAVPGDASVAGVAGSFTRLASVKSLAPGATVEIQDYLDPSAAWYKLGTTPLARVRMPNGYFRWKVSQPGHGEFVSAAGAEDSMTFPFPQPADVPPGMVHVPAGPYGDLIGFIGWVNYELPAFDMDRFEVTNADYQKFVDQGGYRKREYWKEKFIRDGKELSWEQAMNVFRDPTGRQGPSTWDAGHFPNGQAAYPVSGVSWYEASAYAVFAGKSLPALGEWFKAAPSDFARYTINQSNFSGKGPVAVGSTHAVGPYGTEDLMGNVREWCLNVVDGDRRFILGGAWGTQTYQAYDPEALPPFDRSSLNGFRGVRNNSPLAAATAAPVVRQVRDFSKAKPANDQIFRLYRAMYAYDRRPLNARLEGAVEKTADWTKQKISIDAGYDNERLPLFLFLPNHVRGPYQTVVFFPSASVDTLPSSANLGDMEFIDYVIKSGRAVVYPIYRDTYERSFEGQPLPGQVGNRELGIQVSKEMRRAVDYLETRPDVIDTQRLAYLGVSQGSAWGVMFMALENRFKAAVFLDGGYFLNPQGEGADQADFAPRVKMPVLMVNGKYDFTFPPDQSQAPMFAMLGTPAADKSRVLLDTPHDVSQQKPELSKAVLDFLDKYLGLVN